MEFLELQGVVKMAIFDKMGSDSKAIEYYTK